MKKLPKLSRESFFALMTELVPSCQPHQAYSLGLLTQLCETWGRYAGEEAIREIAGGKSWEHCAAIFRKAHAEVMDLSLGKRRRS